MSQQRPPVSPATRGRCNSHVLDEQMRPIDATDQHTDHLVADDEYLHIVRRRDQGRVVDVHRRWSTAHSRLVSGVGGGDYRCHPPDVAGLGGPDRRRVGIHARDRISAVSKTIKTRLTLTSVTVTATTSTLIHNRSHRRVAGIPSTNELRKRCW